MSSQSAELLELPINMLFSARDAHLVPWALQSFFVNVGHPKLVRLFADRNVTEGQICEIVSALADEPCDIKFIPHEEAFSALAARVTDPYLLRNYITLHPPLLRFASVCFEDARYVQMLDPDVLFIAPISLENWKNCDAVVMKDVQWAYSFNPRQCWRIPTMRFVPLVNTGWTIFRKEALDWELFDFWIRNSNIYASRHIYWLDQTIFASLMGRKYVYYFAQDKVGIFKENCNRFVIHFAGNAKQFMRYYVDKKVLTDVGELRLSLDPAPTYSFAGWLMRRAASRLGPA